MKFLFNKSIENGISYKWKFALFKYFKHSTFKETIKLFTYLLLYDSQQKSFTFTNVRRSNNNNPNKQYENGLLKQEHDN